MKFESDRPRFNLLMQCRWQTGVAFTHKAQVHGKSIGGLEHAFEVPRARRTSGGKRTGGRTRTAAHHGGNSAG